MREKTRAGREALVWQSSLQPTYALTDYDIKHNHNLSVKQGGNK